ncbi:MAG: hypothetical protein HKN93_01510, partial [Acidimicrobiia bacterium]|nr:hypothetical protein [Acidimicrobiia bacterium]
MDFHPVTEVLYAGGGSTFGTINQSSGVFTSIGTFGSGNGSSGVRTFDNVQALAFDPTSGVLYAVHVEGTSDSYLFAVDPATGSAVTDFFGSDEYVRIQTTATRKLVWAIAIDDLGQMYGIQTSSGDGAVRFVRINKVTGARNDVSTLDTYILRGMTLTDTGELWVSGKTTGPTVHGMYRINPATGAIVETVPIDNGADYQSIAAQLTLTATLITGTVFEDITGDALHDGGYPGDAGDNPPVAGAQVYLYVDAGTAGPDNGDALSGVVPNPATTDANGHYAFYGVPDGNYYVVVDSRTIAPTAGINGGFAQGDVWAQQTYGGIGTAFGAGAGWGWSATPRAVYGGYSGYQTAVAVSDTFTPATPGDAEHVNRVVVSGGASVTDVDLGFSFNVVTNLGAPGTEDDDGGANRTVQGSLRQFIQNANAIVGPNAMYFATEPVFDPTDTAGIHEWYSTTITNNLPTITDPDTTIDGSLWDSTRSGLGNARNINSVTLGYVGGVGTGADGVSGNGDDMTLDGVPGPELEINDGPGSTSGILSTASRTTVQHISIWGFGVVGDDGNIRIGPHGSNITGIDINNVVLGTGANALADPGASRTLGSNVIAEDATSGALPAELNSITDSILVFTDASNVSLANEGGWLIQGNEINGAGIGAANGQYKDAISLGGSPSGHTIIGNYIGGAHGVGVDTWQDPGGHTVTDNTITNNGLSVIVEEQAGVRLFGTGSTVEHNIISGNTGAAVIIVGERQPTLPTWSAGTGNLISENEFGANTTISIDLVEATDSDITHGLGDGVNGNNSDNNELTTGNLGIDSPVITAAVSSGGSVTVSGTQFNCDTCTVEVYAAVADGDGSDTVGLDDFGEAITYLGSATVSGTTWSLVATPAVIPTDVTALVFDGASNTSELAQNEPVVLAADFVGRVFHDIVGDQLADDGDADLETNDANNPWLPGVDVYLYEDTGPLIGQPDVVDALYVGPTNPVTTDANGRFQFLGLPAGRTFYVVVDSTTVSPPATTASTDSYWAEQTYGPAGSLVGGAPTGVNGPLYGGDDAAVEDTFGGTTLTGAEHIARLASANPGISDLYFGFSFNVVVNVDANAGGSAIQGSLDQFIQNANKVDGANAMRFVPGVATNAPSWWRIDYTPTVNPLSSINDADTTIDGTAHSSGDGTTPVDPNSGYIGANATGGLVVGVDGLPLVQVEKPELEIINDGLRVDISGGLVPNNTRITALSIWGATSSVDIGLGVIDGIVVERAVVGSPPDALADPGGGGVWAIGASSTASVPAQGGVIRDSLVGFVNQAGITLETASADWTVSGNEVTDTGNAPSAYDAVLLWGAAAVVTGNYIHD